MNAQYDVQTIIAIRSFTSYHLISSSTCFNDMAQPPIQDMARAYTGNGKDDISGSPKPKGKKQTRANNYCLRRIWEILFCVYSAPEENKYLNHQDSF
ncbi:hypothetical protein AVEN_80446-1 [Araneus ventricosus]|uniref:Uncharacterized protein n=1 Tax=Araneus ventricosus TaxID=182803 RepID=A0A4Y2HAQ0_ARAVE|nr:hypothetical protein AVEN_80446-1 [Araneus ventricosus]